MKHQTLTPEQLASLKAKQNPPEIEQLIAEVEQFRHQEAKRQESLRRASGKGGKQSAKSMTAEQRKERSQKANEAKEQRRRERFAALTRMPGGGAQ